MIPKQPSSETKGIFIGTSLLIILIVGIFFWGYLNHHYKEKNNARADRAYQFERNEFASFKNEKKDDISVFLRSFEEMYADNANHGRAFVLGIEIVDYLYSIEKNEEALQILAVIKGNGLGKIQHYLVGTRQAMLQEELGLIDEAIVSLEELIEASALFLEEKIYLDLGRLYSTKNQTDKASEYFQYVIDKGKDQKFLKEAKLFLSELK